MVSELVVLSSLGFVMLGVAYLISGVKWKSRPLQSASVVFFIVAFARIGQIGGDPATHRLLILTLFSISLIILVYNQLHRIRKKGENMYRYTPAAMVL